MTAVALHQPLPDDLREEMARLQMCGFSLLPLRGKAPMVANWTDRRLTLPQVLGPMNRTYSQTYGIRLDDLAVLDCDDQDASLIASLERRFGEAAVHVRTPRGIHLYYQRPVGPLPSLRSEGLPVDLKAGFSSYVVGPLSCREDSGTYDPTKGCLGQRLGVLRLPATEPRVREGDRHARLVSEAISMVGCVDSPEELMDNITYIRDTEFERPDEVPDTELRGVVDWAWSRRLANKVYAGRQSEFRVSRIALDRLKALPNASDAISLYTVLVDQHGHSSGKAFPLAWKAMKDTGHTNLPRKRFAEAKRALIGANLLGQASKHVAGARCQTFRLLRPLPDTSGGEGLILTYVDQFGASRSGRVGQHG